MSRRKGRILAFQALYSWDVSKTSLEDLLTFSWLQKDSESTQSEEETQISASEQPEKIFAGLIISGTIQNIQAIDDLIKAHLSASWTFERINKVTLAILRTSIYELKYQTDSQAKVVIDEAVNIAKEFGTDDSYKFINAVLDKIGKDAKDKS
ncbi:MAG: transcription antitermination factor NusB [Treponema sp.]|nr:transcription antitermination factor NusB [Treponema sp.]